MAKYLRMLTYINRINLCQKRIIRNLHQEKSINLPDHADAIVIGGGSIGCSTLYHLAKYGIKNCILLERDKLTSGTTWHTAGLYWSLRPSDIEIELLIYSKRLITQILPQEAEIDVGWINNGGLFIASTKERMDEYKRMYSLAPVYGLQAHLLGPSETKKLYPLMNVDDVYGTLYSPGDGLIDPSSWCTALTKAARKYGANIFEHCPVKEIVTRIDDLGNRKVEGIRTYDDRLIKSKIIVNCAGAWAPKLCKPLGVNLPTMALQHAYATTERIGDQVRGLPNIRDHDAAIYIRLQGDALTFGGYEPNPVYWEDVKDDFSFGLFDLDWDRFGIHVKGACNRLPILKSTGIKSNICGPLSFTPDHKPILGETLEVKGLFLACGIELGMMMGGGIGRQAALWAIHERPEKHLFAYDIRRFNPKLTGRYGWIKEKLHEAVYTMYKIHWPRDEPLSGRNQLKSPFHDFLLNNGCVFQERHGWERPGWFAEDDQISPVLPYDYYGAYGPKETQRHQHHLYEHRLTNDYNWQFPKHHDLIGEECKAVRNGLAFIDMSSYGKFYLSGPDVEKAIDYIFSSDITSKPSCTSTYTLMLNKNGGVETELVVSIIDSKNTIPSCTPKFDDSKCFYISVGAGLQTHAWTHIHDIITDKKYNVKLMNYTNKIGILGIHGPDSIKLLGTMAGDMPIYTHRIISIKGHQCRIFRLPFVGETSYELHIPIESCRHIYENMVENGKKFGLKHIGFRAIDSVLAENDYRSWDNDLRSTDTALEANLFHLCDKINTDKDFLGREALQRQQKEGLHRKIACFTLDSQTPLWGLEAIYRNGQVVGFIRRAEYAYTMNKPIGFGYLSLPDNKIITDDWINSGDYEIEAMGTRYKAKVHLKTPLESRI